jgi:hypothetical protein
LSTAAPNSEEHRLANSLALCHQVDDKVRFDIAPPKLRRPIKPTRASKVSEVSQADVALVAEANRVRHS